MDLRKVGIPLPFAEIADEPVVKNVVGSTHKGIEPLRAPGRGGDAPGQDAAMVLGEAGLEGRRLGTRDRQASGGGAPVGGDRWITHEFAGDPNGGRTTGLQRRGGVVTPAIPVRSGATAVAVVDTLPGHDLCFRQQRGRVGDVAGQVAAGLQTRKLCRRRLAEDNDHVAARVHGHGGEVRIAAVQRQIRVRLERDRPRRSNLDQP